MTAHDSPHTFGPVEVTRALWMSLNDRPHWSARHRKTRALREIGGWQARAAGLGGLRLGPTLVTAWISYPTNTRADPSNAAGVIKALIDGMVDVGVWIDDDHEHVIGPKFMRAPKTGRPGIYVVRLDLMPWPVLTPGGDA